MSASEIKSKVEAMIETIEHRIDDDGLFVAYDPAQQQMLDGLVSVKDFVETCIQGESQKDGLQYLIDEAMNACEALVGVCETLSSGSLTIEDISDIEKSIEEIESGLMAAIQRVTKKEGE